MNTDIKLHSALNNPRIRKRGSGMHMIFHPSLNTISSLFLPSLSNYEPGNSKTWPKLPPTGFRLKLITFWSPFNSAVTSVFGSSERADPSFSSLAPCTMGFWSFGCWYWADFAPRRRRRMKKAMMARMTRNATPPATPPTMAPMFEVPPLEPVGTGDAVGLGVLDEDVDDIFAVGVYANALARAASLNVGFW